MAFSCPALVRKVKDGNIGEKVLDPSEKIVLKCVGIHVGYIQTHITEIFFDDLHDIAETVFRYRQGKDIGILRIDDSEMYALVLFFPASDIIYDITECLVIEHLGCVDGDSVSAQTITEIQGLIHLLFIEIIGNLDDFDRQLMFFRELFDIVHIPRIKIFPDCYIQSIESGFFDKLKSQIQSISGKGIRTKKKSGFFGYLPASFSICSKEKILSHMLKFWCLFFFCWH